MENGSLEDLMANFFCQCRPSERVPPLQRRGGLESAVGGSTVGEVLDAVVVFVGGNLLERETLGRGEHCRRWRSQRPV